MSAIFGALSLFYALAFAATIVALAADDRPSLWPRSQRVVHYPPDSITDDERVLTTGAAPAAQPIAKAAAEHVSDGVRAA